MSELQKGILIDIFKPCTLILDMVKGNIEFIEHNPGMNIPEVFQGYIACLMKYKQIIFNVHKLIHQDALSSIKNQQGQWAELIQLLSDQQFQYTSQVFQAVVSGQQDKFVAEFS